MKKLRLISLILCIVLLVSALSGCIFARSVPTGVNSDGKFVYSITRSGDNTNIAAEDAAKALRGAMKEGLGVSISLLKDSSLESEEAGYEILVGDTTREESAKAKQMLMDNRPNYAHDFIIVSIDKKICIQAIQDEMLTAATDWFIATFCGSVEDFAKIKTNYKFIYAPENTESELSVAGKNIGEFAVVVPRVTSFFVANPAQEFVKAYLEYGYSVPLNRDTDEEAEYEILFGDCNREASKSVTVEGDNYVIKVIGKKIVIKGGSDLAAYYAGQKFLKEICEKTGELSDGYTLNGKYDPEEEGAYTLNWGDEFNDSTVDLTKWSDYNRGAKVKGGATSLGGISYTQAPNGDCAYSGEGKKNLIYESDGKVTLACQRIGDDFISSRFGTFETMMYKYGLIEICSKLSKTPSTVSYWLNAAAVGGQNMTNRFGDQTRSCFTEIDILENFGSNVAFAANVHRWWTTFKLDGTSAGSSHNSMDNNSAYTGNSKNNKRFKYDTEKYGDDLADDYHVYSFYWDDKCMKFAFDGVVYCDYQYLENMSVSVHCLMNYFLTGCKAGDPAYGETYDKDIHDDYFEHKIDWIRVYQTDAVNSQLITAWPQDVANGKYTVYYPENSAGGEY